MRIEKLAEQQWGTMRFDRLASGVAFEFDARVYVRVAEHAAINAVDLANGTLCSFLPTLEVICIDATLTWSYK